MPKKELSPIWAEVIRMLDDKGWMLKPYDLLFLVKLRNNYQKHRKAADQITGAKGVGVSVIETYSEYAREAEKTIERIFKKAAEVDPVSRWATSIMGIGPVHALTVRGYVDIKGTQYAGRIWRFAGLTPDTPKQQTGQKLAFCRPLKTACFLIAESFKKLSNNPKSFYGAMYKSRKLYELERNDAGGNAEAAAQKLRECKVQNKAHRAAYESGKLPAGHLDMRAMRWTVKLFLAHWFEVAYRDHNNAEPPKPYIIAHGNGKHSRLLTVDDVLAYERAEEVSEVA